MTPEMKGVIVFVVSAASVPILEALIRLDANAVLADPKPWAVGVVAASIRAAASAILGWLVRDRIVPHDGALDHHQDEHAV